MGANPRQKTANQAQKKRPNPWKLGLKGSKTSIEAGQCGIFVTCNRNQESKCVAELLDILSQDLEDKNAKAGEANEEPDDDCLDIEEQIKREVDGMNPNVSNTPFQALKTDVPCVSFVRFNKSLNPVETVRRVCREAQAHPERQRSRKIQRLTPVTLVHKVLGNGLESLAREVVAPHFHSGGPSMKYAVRPSIRQNTDWHKDTVAKVVADVIGPEHPVDLRNYDVLILVEVMRNLCAMSVVGRDYDELKKYNLAEIHSPTPRPKQVTDKYSR